jgi:hypothetical protein
VAKRKDNDSVKPLVISVRVIEKETSDDFVRYISAIRDDRKKNLSPIALQMMYEGYKSMMGSQGDKILLPLPCRLTKKQKEWLKHDLSLAFLSDVIVRILDKVTSDKSIDITSMIDEETKNVSSFIKKRNEVIREPVSQQIAPHIAANDSDGSDVSSESPQFIEKNDVTNLKEIYTSNNVQKVYNQIENEQDQNDDIFAIASSLNNFYAD